MASLSSRPRASPSRQALAFLRKHVVLPRTGVAPKKGISVLGRHGGLTLRSTRRPPATHQGRETLRHIICLAALALRWRPRVTSNVRPSLKTVGRAPVPAESALCGGVHQTATTRQAAASVAPSGASPAEAAPVLWCCGRAKRFAAPRQQLLSKELSPGLGHDL